MADRTDEFRELGEKIRDKAYEKIAENEVPYPGFDTWLQQEFGDIPDLFASYGRPDPDKLFDLSEEMSDAGRFIDSPEASWLNDASLEITGWSGKAQESFEDYWMSPWEGMRSAHSDLLESLAGAAKQAARLYRDTQNWVRKLGDKTYERLENAEDVGPFGLWGPDPATATQNLASVAVSVAGGNIAAIAVSLFTSGNSLKKSLDLDQTRPEDIIKVMRDKFIGINDHLGETEKDLENGLEDNIGNLEKGLRNILPPQTEWEDVNPQKPGGDVVEPK